MKNKKELTIDDLALMIGKGFNSMDQRFDRVEGRLEKVEKEVKLVKLEVEDVKLRLDNVAHRFELNALEQKFEKRFRVLEIKAGVKHTA
jgi:tetrahydromethanopterin S-methyltransferase subunit G